MQALENLRKYFAAQHEVASVYLYGKYGQGPSYADTDIEVALLFDEDTEEDDVRAFLESTSEADPLGGEPGVLMPFALNTHILPVIYEVLTSATLLVDNRPRVREAFAEQARQRLSDERASLLDDAREAIAQARSLGLAATATSGFVLPQPPRYLDPIRIGWRIGRILASVAVLEATTRDLEAAGRDPERIAQAVGWFSNAAGAATGIAKAMLTMFDMERPPRRWQVFLPVADTGLMTMDLALHLGALAELRWQMMASGGLHSADRMLGGIRAGLPSLLAFARMAAWYCEVPGGRGEAKVH